MKPRHTPHIPPHIASLQPYQPGLTIESLARKSGLSEAEISKLASNENPYGMSPKSKAALRHSAHAGHYYPDGHELTAALARHYHLSPDQIALGNGSNDIIDLIARVFLGPGTNAVSSQYAFAIYALVTQTSGGTNIITPATPGLGHDLSAMQAAITPTTRVIWLANPNNPTGTFVPYAAVKSFLEAVPPHIMVVLDEAYYEYLPPEHKVNSIAWLADHPNLILLRTFSKIYGLAGLRLGYSLASPTITELINRVRQPFNASSVALATAVAALGDQDFARLSYERNRRGLRQLQTGLTRLGVSFTPSVTNFVTIQAPQAMAVYDDLLARGVIVRPLAGDGLPEHLRVSVGRPHENRRFLAALKQILAAQA